VCTAVRNRYYRRYPARDLGLDALFGIKPKITKRLGYLLGYLAVTVNDLVRVALELSPT
jgi:hypothetical protein